MCRVATNRAKGQQCAGAVSLQPKERSKQQDKKSGGRVDRFREKCRHCERWERSEKEREAATSTAAAEAGSKRVIKNPELFLGIFFVLFVIVCSVCSLCTEQFLCVLPVFGVVFSVHRVCKEGKVRNFGRKEKFVQQYTKKNHTYTLLRPGGVASGPLCVWLDSESSVSVKE